jgi:hypothetical protein
MNSPDRSKFLKGHNVVSSPETAATNPNTTFDTAMSDATGDVNISVADSHDDVHDDILDDLLASPVQQHPPNSVHLYPDTQQGDDLMILDDLLAFPSKPEEMDSLDDILVSPTQQDTPLVITSKDTSKSRLASPTHKMQTVQASYTEHKGLKFDTSMTHVSLSQPRLPLTVKKYAVKRPSPPLSPLLPLPTFGTRPSSSKPKKYIYSRTGSWIENPRFRKKQSKQQGKTPIERISSYPNKRQSSTVPLDCPIAERSTQCWLNRTSLNIDSVPSFQAPTVSSSRKRKCTIPLESPIADKHTESWLAKHEQLKYTPRLERNKNKSRRLNPNYLPSSVISQHNNSTAEVSSLVFPQPVKHHRYTVSEIVPLADRSTQAWDSKMLDRKVKAEVSCPYLVRGGGGTLITPNGQYSIYGNKRMKR